MRLIGLVIILLSFSFTTPPPETKFEYVFKVGDKYHVEQNSKQVMKQTIMGSEQSFDNIFLAAYTLDVVEITSSGAKVKVEYAKIKNELKSAMINSVMDSEGAAETTENKVFKSIVNKPFHLFISKRGEIEKLEGTDNLWTGLPSSGIDENTQKMLKQNLQQLLGEDMIKATMQQMLVTYSDKKVKTGDSWKVNNIFPIGFPVKIDDSWTFESGSANEAFFSGDGTAVSDKDKVIEVQGGLKAKADLSGRQARKSTVNVKTGWPTKLELLAEMKGNMTLLAGGMIPEDMNIPMEIVTETSFMVSKK